MNNIILLNKINTYFHDFIHQSSNEDVIQCFGEFSEVKLIFTKFNGAFRDEQYYDIFSFDLTLLKNYNSFLEQSIFVIEVLIKEFDITSHKYNKILFQDGSEGVFYNLGLDEVYYGDKVFNSNTYFNLGVNRIDTISDLAKEQKF